MNVTVTVTLAGTDVYASASDGRTWTGKWPWQFGPAPAGFISTLTTAVQQGRAKLHVPPELVAPAKPWMRDRPRHLNLTFYATLDTP